MIINNKRALAYIVKIDEIKPLDGYDRVEYARTNGWWCVVGKDQFKVNDKAIYFEVDSLVPSDDARFSFMEKRNYKVKTQKMCKVISQGLLMPLYDFPELGDLSINDDVTDLLKVKYYIKEDNERKKDEVDSNKKYLAMAARNKKLFKNKFIKKLMEKEWGRKVLFFFFGKKKDNSKGWPTHFEYIHKTDEERVENMPFVLSYSSPCIVTEKLDGTSSTYILEKKKKLFSNEYEFYVLSRNVRQMNESQKTYHDHNIYWDMAFKYNIEEKLKKYLEKNINCPYVCLQGESVGSVQGNPLKLKEDDFYCFNFIDGRYGRISSLEGKKIVEEMGIKWVPILDTNYFFPNDMEKLKEQATGFSAVNPNVYREGVVIRDPVTDFSCKNVSREYLLKHE